MGTRRRRKGGVAIASGSDGCVFDTHFNDDGTVVKVDKIVSKVFPDDKLEIATNEFIMMGRVEAATKGLGVVVSTDPVRTINALNDTIPDEIVKGKGNACAQIVKQMKNGNSRFHVLESPRVKGSLLTVKKGGETTIPIDFFKDAITAVRELGANGIAQMDIASRNIFVSNDDKALIADFGSALNVSDTNFDKRVRWYAKKYGIEDVYACLYDFGSSANARIAMMMYTAPDLAVTKQAIESQLEKAPEYVFMDCYENEIKNAPEDWKFVLIEEMAAYLNMMKNMTDRSAILDVLKKEICRSDSRMLAMLLLKWCGTGKEVVEEAKSLWYSDNYEKWQAAQVPKADVPKAEDAENIDDKIAKLKARLAALKRGGRRKTRRKQGKRVKMSRRR